MHSPEGVAMTISRRALLVSGTTALTLSPLRTILPTAVPTAIPTAGAAGVEAAAGIRPRFPGDPGRGRVYYGAFVQFPRNVERYERRLGHRLGARRSYFLPHQAEGLVRRARHDVAARRLPLVSTKVPGSWRDVATGASDDWLHPMLDGLAAIDRPVFLTLHHEPENDVAGPGNLPGWFVEMQEHALAAAAARAPLVSIVPILMSWTFDPASGRTPGQWIAPSPALFGFDAYNWWSPRTNAPWTGFGTLLRRAERYAGGRPLVVGEFGVRRDPRRPQRSARWLRNAYRQAVRNDVVAMTYFDQRIGDPDGDFRLTGPRLAAFRRNLRRPRSVLLR